MQIRENDRLEGIGLVRLTSWAAAAAVAVAIASMASFTPGGSQRLAAAVTSFAGDDMLHAQAAQAARQAEIDYERRSLREALRVLAMDRDRLVTRVSSLERNLDDITGSIKSEAERPRPEITSMRAEPPEIKAPPAVTASAAQTKPPVSQPSDLPDWLAKVPAPWPSPSAGMEFAPGPASLSFPAAAPRNAAAAPPPVRVAALSASPQPATVTTANAVAGAPARADFGVDIGSGSSLEEVRLLWNTARTQHGRLLGSLRPIIVKREDPAGNPDYRLVVGPLANADAAKLCATLGSADVMCSTRLYQGERLRP